MPRFHKFILVLLVPYGWGFSASWVYFTWAYIKVHSFFDFILGGEFIGLLKAVIWPYFAYRYFSA